MLTVILLLALCVLPLWVRIMRLQSEVTDLRRRLAWLERLPAGTPAAPSTDAAPSVTRHRAPAPIAPVATGPVILSPLPEHMEEQETIEGQIGGRVLLYAGMMVLVIGIAFFLRYAFDHQWMSPTVRITLGAMVGIALGMGGYRLAALYRGYGLFLCGGGIAVLFLSVYAALNLYSLIAPLLAFTLLAAIAVTGAWLADRTRSQPLAFMAVCGGFLAPFLVGGDRDAQVTLFTYDTLLVAATTFLSRRQDWPWLNVASLVFTGLSVVAWADVYYTPEKYLRTELFLTLYCAMFVAILWSSRRSQHQHAALASGLLGAAPVAYHVASVVILSPHGLALPVYLIPLTVLCVVAGLQLELPALRLVAWIAVALPLFAWMEAHQSRVWVPAAVLTMVAIHAVHLGAQVRTAARGPLRVSDVLLLQVNGAGVFAGLYEALLNTTTVPQLALVACALSAANAGLWWAMRRVNTDAGLQWASMAFTLLAVAVALEFDGPWTVAMWAAEAAAIAWAGIRTDRPWLRAGSALLFLLAIRRWLQPDVQDAYFGQGAVLNARALSGLFMIATLYVVASLQRTDRHPSGSSRRRERAGVLIAASALTVFAMSKEITAFWNVRTNAAEAYLARELMLSAAWATYAGLLVAIGMRRRYAPIRYFAIALFGLTLGKVFLVDLGTLGGIYRIAAFIAIGLILLLVSFLYQRDRKRAA